MIERSLRVQLIQSLAAFPAVALLGPRQVGKTPLARSLEEGWSRPVVYLDLERDSDRARLAEAELYLQAQWNSLVILDEVQRMPELFPLLRSLIDERVRGGDAAVTFSCWARPPLLCCGSRRSRSRAGSPISNSLQSRILSSDRMRSWVKEGPSPPAC